MANNLAAFNAEVWSKSIIMNLDRKNVMLPFTDRRFEGEVDGVGSVVKVRTLGNIIMSDYTSGGSISYQDLIPSVETMTVANQKSFAFSVDDVDKIQNDEDLLQLYAGRGAVAIGNTVDDHIFTTYSSAHTDNKITSGGAGSDGNGAVVTLTATTSGTSVYDNLVLAGVALSNKNAELTDRWVVIDPKTHGLLLKDTNNFSRATDKGDAITSNGVISGGPVGPGGVGMVGRCAGFNVFLSTALPRNGSTGKYIVYGQGQPIHYVSKLTNVEAIRLETQFGTAIRGLLVHQAKVFTENAKRLGYIYATI